MEDHRHDARTRTTETDDFKGNLSTSPPTHASSQIAAGQSTKPQHEPTLAQSYSLSTNDPERQETNNTTLNEKSLSRQPSSSCNPYRIWPPWKREDGWKGWRDEWVRKDALVIPLIVQAFSAGVLDATTYADFQTFASNRESHQIRAPSRSKYKC
jgi:hypothetical protein